MRTTLDIDADVLQAAKETAKREKTSVGRVLSEWARQVLTPSPPTESAGSRNGVPVLPSRANAGVVTLEAVNQLREEEP